jgi:ABC-type sulfate transport system permease component
MLFQILIIFFLILNAAGWVYSFYYSLLDTPSEGEKTSSASISGVAIVLNLLVAGLVGWYLKDKSIKSE